MYNGNPMFDEKRYLFVVRGFEIEKTNYRPQLIVGGGGGVLIRGGEIIERNHDNSSNANIVITQTITTIKQTLLIRPSAPARPSGIGRAAAPRRRRGGPGSRLLLLLVL